MERKEELEGVKHGNERERESTGNVLEKLWSSRNRIMIILCVIAERNPKRIRQVGMPGRIFTPRMGFCTATGNPIVHMSGSA